MRVNVYAEELTDRLEIVEKTIGDVRFVGLRIYLELPVTLRGPELAGSEPVHVRGPYLAEPCGDGSSAITLWSKGDLLMDVLRKAVELLELHEGKAPDHG